MGGVALATRAWRSECAGWLALGAAAGPQPLFALERCPPALVCAWWRGDPGCMENNLLVENPAADPVAGLAAVAPTLAASASGTDLRLPPGPQAEAWGAAARGYGFADRGSDVLMVCGLGGLRAGPAPSPGLTVGRCLDPEAHDQAVQVIRRVYGDSGGVAAFFNPRGLVDTYLARLRGHPAAAASLWCLADVAGVFSVATLPEYRHRGLARAVVDAMLRDAAARDFGLAALRTADRLVPMYARHGFVVAGRIRRLHRSAPPPRA